MDNFNFQKRPYRAKSIQWQGDNLDEIKKLLADANGISDIQLFREEYVMIRYTGGIHTLQHSNWVIKGEDGMPRFYTNEVFLAKYQPLMS